MKLIKCYIQNFGKLKDFSYGFQNGINIIKQDNGFGKTTFATFIKSMFYGLDAQANAKIEKSDRKRYIPWQGGIYGGNIEFELNNKKYRIERTFGKKASEDTFKLYNLETNLESQDYTENIGEEIFKINKSAYERSTYIPQGQVKIEMEDSISAKLGNVLEGDNDVNTSEEALRRLNEAKKIYKKDRGQGGLIDEKKNKLFDLQRKLENARLDTANLEIREKQLEEKIKEINNFESKREEIQKLLSKKIELDRIKAKKENYDAIIKKFNLCEKEYNNLRSFFESGIPNAEILQNLINQNNELEKTKIEIENLRESQEEQQELYTLQNKFKNESITLEDINNKILEFSQIQEIENEIEKKKNQEEQKEDELKIINKKNRKSLLIASFSVLLILVGTILILLNIQKIAGFVTIFLGIIICVLKVFGKKTKNSITKTKRDIININKEIETLRTRKEDIKNDVEDYIKKYFTQEETNIMMNITNLKSEFSRYKELQNSKNTRDFALKNLKLKLENLKKEVENILSHYFTNMENGYTELIQDLKLNINRFESLNLQLQEVLAEKEKFEKENDIEELNNVEDVDISEEETKLQIEKYNKQIDGLVDEKNQIKNYIEVLENKIDENEYLESEIEALKEEINKLEEKYKIIKTTEDLLKTSKESYSSSYLKDMILGFNKYVSFINSEELKTAVDTNLGVKIDVNGTQKEIKTFSSGYKDLIYICMRLSLVDALFKEEKPFVVLDDPFINLDDYKTAKALEILNEFAKRYQVIYFSCNTSRI